MKQFYRWCAELKDGALFYEFDKQNQDGAFGGNETPYKSLHFPSIRVLWLEGAGKRFGWNMTNCHFINGDEEFVFGIKSYKEKIAFEFEFEADAMIQTKDAFQDFNAKFININSGINRHNIGVVKRLNIMNKKIELKLIATAVVANHVRYFTVETNIEPLLQDSVITIRRADGIYEFGMVEDIKKDEVTIGKKISIPLDLDFGKMNKLELYNV